MSTNYYAHWNVSDNVTIRFHIGQFAAGGYMLSGVHFPTWNTWKEFLVHNEDDLRIENEYGMVFAAEQIIALIEESDRSKRLEWYRKNKPESIDHEGRGKNKVWADEDGFVFYNGEFF